ncbi:PhzF family phenazine biosynthesis protein [Saccharospirillum mangrovi]|uniref:PhzF family phenazine biosynthesis protein n=1 Tax=Saccharospirillum mangrovi TaxID=2161747 RepID=UPI000D39C910|nr:PhzF family phenazine biosynthesis protein [Saccharospirillum mangrovi]
MAFPIYQVDAFADAIFQGNPAAVMVLNEPLRESIMQQLAMENNLSETAFVCRQGDDWQIRWFTPGQEVKLCGHATLASAHVLWNELNCSDDILRLHSRSGLLEVRRRGDLLELDFPAYRPEAQTLPAEILGILGHNPVETVVDDFMMAVLDSEQQVADFERDFSQCLAADHAVILTARSERPGVDFVSRVFCGPNSDLIEDPVTGSAHCLLAPYWGAKLDKTILQAEQISKRGGRLECELKGDRVRIRGRAKTYLRGFVEWTS